MEADAKVRGAQEGRIVLCFKPRSTDLDVNPFVLLLLYEVDVVALLWALASDYQKKIRVVGRFIIIHLVSPFLRSLSLPLIHHHRF